MPRKDISVRTADGSAPAGLFTPGGAVPASGVILYMDAFGPRPALDEMADRLAGQGHAVLAPDLFYRFGDYGAFDAKTAFSDPEKGAQLRKMIGETTQAGLGHVARAMPHLRATLGLDLDGVDLAFRLVARREAERVVAGGVRQRLADEARDVVTGEESPAAGSVCHQDETFLGVRQRAIALATRAVPEAGRGGVLVRRADRIERDARRVRDDGAEAESEAEVSLLRHFVIASVAKQSPAIVPPCR